MKKVLQKLATSTGMLMMAGSLAIPAYASTDDIGVKLQVNDELVQFADETPYVDENGFLQVPIRLVCEKLNLPVQWKMKGNEVKVTINNQDASISFQTGDNQAVVRGKPVKMESKALMREGTVYVPVRFISEVLGYKVQWDDSNRIAIIDADGNYHAPAWYAPQEPVVVSTALRYLGVPYAWGGTTPSGFDCSGFVRYVFNQHHLDLPRTSQEMYVNAGVSVSEAQTGDLVFFGKNRVFHVGIYLGDGKFISSTSSNGIHVEQLNSGYWNRHYIGAKRII